MLRMRAVVLNELNVYSANYNDPSTLSKYYVHAEHARAMLDVMYFCYAGYTLTYNHVPHS